MVNLINVQTICAVIISGTTIYESGTSLASKYAPINSCGTITNALCLGGNPANTYAPIASPVLTGTIDSDTLRVGYCNTSKSLNIYDGANPSWHALRFSTNATGGTIQATRNGGTVSALSLQNESGEIMRIANNNKVSIGGCTTPAQALDVCGGIVASTNICAVKFLENGTCLANSYLPIVAPAFCNNANIKGGGSDYTPNLAVGYVQGEIWGGNSTSDRGFLRLSAGGGSSLSAKVAIDLQGYSSSGCCYSELIRFLTAGNNVRMTITCGGNVAFGTCPNPSAVVDVCGGVKATSSICAGTCVCGGCVYGSTCVQTALLCSTGNIIGTVISGNTSVYSLKFSTPNYYINENGGSLAIRNSCSSMLVQMSSDGNVCLLTGNLRINPSICNYANNSAAIAGGLQIGTFYRNGDILQIVHS